ncbi:MarR family transcriptional regulator [Streptomyces triticagri]|uniref:MarR family transcriptional regulator n=1 Tax=Streptomyces triticagri TaxID=2293568 RepID=A0A372M9I0_9ACTN|nr:MarR family winged helix-turn-helix transcriptional regulator [Streptomyces triticagri]RFU86947.1 MarR family transcriptional regulator [Streptomyces triticagri]
MTADQQTHTGGDRALAAEPIAYWTGMAHKEVLAFIRAQQAKLGFTQPQYWILRHLSPHDLATDGGRGMTVPEMIETMKTYLQFEDDLAAEAETLLDRGWITRGADGRLRITEAGDTARADLKTHAPAWRDLIHDGIDDADYVTTVRVLQRMLRNVRATEDGSDPQH